MRVINYSGFSEISLDEWYATINKNSPSQVGYHDSRTEKFFGLWISEAAAAPIIAAAATHDRKATEAAIKAAFTAAGGELPAPWVRTPNI